MSPPKSESVFDCLDPPRYSKSQARAARRAKRAAAKGQPPPLVPKNASQRRYIDALRRGESAFGIGPAGTGKTYIPARIAARKLIDGAISKIVIARPSVAPKRHALGFLPGRLEQKMAPWLVPIFDAFRSEMTGVALDKFRQEGKIEVVPFEFMRGRSFQDAVVILDEGQNCCLSDLKLFLTRIGEDCQVVVTGDLDQIDIEDSGLFRVLHLAEQYHVPMRVVRFDQNDVVRSAFTKAWVAAFSADDDSNVVNLDHDPAFLHNGRTVIKSG